VNFNLREVNEEHCHPSLNFNAKYLSQLRVASGHLDYVCVALDEKNGLILEKYVFIMVKSLQSIMT